MEKECTMENPIGWECTSSQSYKPNLLWQDANVNVIGGKGCDTNKILLVERIDVGGSQVGFVGCIDECGKLRIGDLKITLEVFIALNVLSIC